MGKKKLPDTPSLSYTSSKTYKKPPKLHNPYLQCLGTPHIDSFNYMAEEGLEYAIADLQPAQLELPSGHKMKITVDEAAFTTPTVPVDVVGVKNQKVMPTECRERAASYKAEFRIRITLNVNGNSITTDKSLGFLPVMLRSKLCHLFNMSPKELVECNEHADTWGGYFIVKGHERLARMLLVTRRNYPVAIRRSGWRLRGQNFSDAGILIRCVRPDQTNTNNVLHFLTSGSCKLMFSHWKAMYYAPLVLMLKCLCDYPDHYIYSLLLNGKKKDLYYTNCIQNMLRELHEEGLHTTADCRVYVGKMFRQKITELPPSTTDDEITEYILKRCVLIHLDNNVDKFHALIYMTQKLFDLVQNKCKAEGADAVSVQEVLVGGHLYLQVLKERLQSLLNMVKITILRTYRMNHKVVDNLKDFQNVLRRCGTFESRMEAFISTGNAPSNNMTLPQYKGLTIVAENINRMRYMSHFKAVHRGAFFTEMRTTEARALGGEAWGFLCPVHTPDGAPCGLLNHLAQRTQITQRPPQDIVDNIPNVLENCGMEPISLTLNVPIPVTSTVYKYPVFVDGRLVGFFAEDRAAAAIDLLRQIKISGDIPVTTEIILIPKKEVCSQYAGVFLATHEARMMRPVLHLASQQLELVGTMEQLYLDIAGSKQPVTFSQVCSQYAGVFLATHEARMMRPVLHLASQQLELVGTMEQLYLDIAVSHAEIIEGQTTHVELSKSAFLSNLAQLVPMPDCNQSPRNMYQCQMGKQTMGTPIHTWATNAETKLYRLQTPATPLFRPMHYDHIGLDDFPMGTNAIVAVISYTGYDMEDAMIINRASHQRGFAAGSIYKSQFVDLDNVTSYFCRDPSKENLVKHMDDDGLPAVGARIQPGDPLYCYFDAEKSKYVVGTYSGKEVAVVDSARLCGDFSNRTPKKACIMLRVQRNPSVGDKFASRAGQKGICSQLWPAEDLPFTESGLVPDILFNPHGFPSRMTIAMMIECMAGKGASLHGQVHDATPFRFNEKDTAIDYFGRLLEQAGYNYYGTERMYSGADGREMNADIFFGVIHYQRLRHMVSDKWQVRTTGAMDALTRQPVKGRRRGGGVRLGEMERDALLSHGASFLLHDRLFHCSDKTQAIICTKCGSLLGPLISPGGGDKQTCRLCSSDGTLATIAIPYIFKFFVTQLAAVNINVKVNSSAITE